MGKQLHFNRISAIIRTIPPIAIGLAMLLTACGAPQPTPAPLPTSAPTFTPAPTDTQAQATAATTLDPCQLVTSEEASALAGVTFGAGAESSTPEGLMICTYGAQTGNIFTVDAIQAADVATANKYKDQFLADLQANLAQLSSQGLQVTQLPNFADGAVLASANIPAPTGDINGSAIGVLKGTVFFGFSDIVVGGAAPTSQALQDEATHVIGKLP